MTASQKSLTVGIDPGVSNGVAWLQRGKYGGKTMSLEALFRWLAEMRPHIREVHLEWPQGNTAIWHIQPGDSIRKAAKTGRNVGMNHGIAYAIDAYCATLYIHVTHHVPAGRTKDFTKRLAEQHGLGRQSQHVADALFLILH